MISDQTKKNIEEFNDFRQETIEQTYDQVAEKYDDIMLSMGHPDPKHCAQFAKELHPQGAMILDMGCGTGLVGEELVKVGFDSKNIWGIDASQGMLDVTSKKQCYGGELIHMFLGQPASFRHDLYNKFDVVTAAGILAEGHLMSEVFDEMLHALKQGGHAIFTTREMYLEKYCYGKAIEELERRGFWKQIKVSKFKRYENIGDDKQIGRFKPVEAMCFVYQKK